MRACSGACGRVGVRVGMRAQACGEGDCFGAGVGHVCVGCGQWAVGVSVVGSGRSAGVVMSVVGMWGV